MRRDHLQGEIDTYLDCARFTDYCPNGLQVEGREEIARIVTGVTASLALIERILEPLPAGPVRSAVNLPGEVCEGVALVEGFRGDILVWLRLNADGTVARCHPRDPSWFQWPLLEAAIEGNIVADFPLCNKSFNGSYSGHDL